MAIVECIFYDKGCEEGSHHQVLTFDEDTNICSMVTKLHNNQLLAKISGVGDLIAMGEV